METYLAGIDIGTSGAKGMVFDLKGNPLGTAYREYPAPTLARDGSSRTPTSSSESTMQAMSQAVRESGVPPARSPPCLCLRSAAAASSWTSASARCGP